MTGYQHSEKVIFQFETILISNQSIALPLAERSHQASSGRQLAPISFRCEGHVHCVFVGGAYVELLGCQGYSTLSSPLDTSRSLHSEGVFRASAV